MEKAEIAALEWANYAAMVATAQATPGLEVVLRDDVILNRCERFPMPDLNHACLLRTTPEGAEALLEEVVAFFRVKSLPTTIYISPACTPGDWPERLRARGFVRQREEEAWMTVGVDTFIWGKPSPAVEVRQIGPEDALTFSRVFLQAFGLPEAQAAVMARLIKPSIGLPDVYHYVAYEGGEAVGVCSLVCYGSLAIVGSMGVVPTRRGRKVFANLGYRVYRDARAQGAELALLQTTAGTLFERFLRISGFERAFVRQCYVLS